MAWVTGSRNRLFFWTQLKLTFFYSIIIIAILLIGSFGLYVSLKKNIKETYTDKIKNHILRQEAILTIDDQIKNDFIFGDFIFIVFSVGLSFIFASKNLLPIKNVLEKQKRFTADASHDLRTPLAIMKTDCEVGLKKKGISKDLKELAKSNLEEINRMSAMVDQLLFLSRNGILNQQMETIRLGDVMDEIITNCRSLAQNKNISLTICKTAAGDILGNRLSLEKMFLNIIKNAIDYTPEGGKIEVFAAKNKNQIEVFIKDTGIGITPEDLPHVTEAFYKADKVRGLENGGSGLGLSIVTEIVKSHSGTMHIESALSEGTSVKLAFPLIG